VPLLPLTLVSVAWPGEVQDRGAPRRSDHGATLAAGLEVPLPPYQPHEAEQFGLTVQKVWHSNVFCQSLDAIMLVQVVELSECDLQRRSASRPYAIQPRVVQQPCRSAKVFFLTSAIAGAQHQTQHGFTIT
jgi:hypothetical protein